MPVDENQLDFFLRGEIGPGLRGTIDNQQLELFRRGEPDPWLDAAVSVTDVAFGQATETDLAQPWTLARVYSFGEAAETDLAQAWTQARVYTLAEALETDLAQPWTVAKVYQLGQAVETDEAQGWGVGETHTYSQATETDGAQPWTVVFVPVGPGLPGAGGTPHPGRDVWRKRRPGRRVIRREIRAYERDEAWRWDVRKIETDAQELEALMLLDIL